MESPSEGKSSSIVPLVLLFVSVPVLTISALLIVWGQLRGRN